MKPLYLCVKPDKYRLPVAVSDSVRELSEMTGRSISSICHSLNRAKNKEEYGTIVKVWITDDEWAEIKSIEGEMK